MQTELDLHKEPIKKLIFKMTTPVMFAGVITTSYSFIDMIFASRLGSIEVASIAFVAPLFIMLQALTSGVIRGGISIIATLLGQSKPQEASAYASQLRLMITVLAIIFSIPGYFLLSAILKGANVSLQLYTQTLLYSKILFVSIPSTLIFQLYTSFFNSQGKMKVISNLSIFGIICNTILNTIFIYLFKLEIEGLAYATLLTSIIQLLTVVFLFKNTTHAFNLSWKTPAQYPKSVIWKKLFSVGLPLSLSQASNHFGFLVLNLFIVQYGHQAVAAFAIGNRIHSLLFFPAKEIGSGLLPLLAQNWGRGAIDRVKETIKLGLIYSVIFGILAAFIIQLIKYPIAHFLTKDDPITYQHVLNYVGLVGWTVIAWAIFHTLQAIFNSFQKTLFALVVDIFRLWGLRIPGIILFYTFVPSLLEYGIWYTMFISNTITVIFAVTYFFMIIPPMLDKHDKPEIINAEDNKEAVI